MLDAQRARGRLCVGTPRGGWSSIDVSYRVRNKRICPRDPTVPATHDGATTDVALVNLSSCQLDYKLDKTSLTFDKKNIKFHVNLTTRQLDMVLMHADLTRRDATRVPCG